MVATQSWPPSRQTCDSSTSSDRLSGRPETRATGFGRRAPRRRQRRHRRPRRLRPLHKQLHRLPPRLRCRPRLRFLRRRRALLRRRPRRPHRRPLRPGCRSDYGDVCGHPRWLHVGGECYGCHVSHIISFDIADDPSRCVGLPHHEFVGKDGKRRNGRKKPPARAQVYRAREACNCTRDTPDWQPAEPRPLRR